MNKGLETLEKCIMQLEEDNKYYNWCQDVRKMKLCLMKDKSILSALCVYNNESPHLEDEVEITFENYEIAKKYLSRLETLEIIKEMFENDINIKRVLNDIVESDNYEDFLSSYPNVSREEFDLLKEVLL